VVVPSFCSISPRSGGESFVHLTLLLAYSMLHKASRAIFLTTACLLPFWRVVSYKIYVFIIHSSANTHAHHCMGSCLTVTKLVLSK
jgi:hypothetical protein